MKRLLLTKIRLTQYFVGFFLLFLAIMFFIPRTKFDSAALTLFSVNSFLYGFYIAPILSSQKLRIEELHKIVRQEANAVFAMMLTLKSFPNPIRADLKRLLYEYVNASAKQCKAGEGEERYEKLISYCVDYRGEHQDLIRSFLEKLVANELNRTNFAMQMTNRVFSNEWMIMLVLFTVTLSFVMLLDAGDGAVYRVLAALLCTGLTMLLVILVKMSTLTHKKAKQIWDPYKTLIRTHFYRID